MGSFLSGTTDLIGRASYGVLSGRFGAIDDAIEGVSAGPE